MRTLTSLALLLCVAAQAGALEVLATRRLDDADRTNVMVLVRNEAAAPVTITDLRLGGVPIAEHMRFTMKRPKLGERVDWFDIRPRTIAPGAAGVIVIGSVVRELIEPVMKLDAVTAEKRFDLSGRAPEPDELKITAAGFDRELKRLTVMVRNDGVEKRVVTSCRVNGNSITVREPLQVPPGSVGVLSSDVSGVSKGDDCNVLVESAAGERRCTSVAWLRAFPAESLTYLFYGQHVDPRELAAKHIDLPLLHHELPSHVADQIDANGGTLPPAAASVMDKRAATLTADPLAWGWYMHDDAAFGQPRPQSLIQLGRYLRDRGSWHRQVLCNPADNARYAWLSDVVMNYSYHTTHQKGDPTVFDGTRSLELTRQLNEPSPVIYLVDTVGQKSRWITPVEEELASYAMLGRGAIDPGWFLGASVWEQGGAKGGGIDRLETMPMRFQEGATANKQVWDEVGRIAAVMQALSPHVAVSTPMRGRLRVDRVEVLPVVCHDGLVVTTLLNRALRCTYPRDDASGVSSGGVAVIPRRKLTVEHELPAWVRPVKVLAFDHDRGLRELEFVAAEGRVSVRVDAVDAATVLMMCPTRVIADELRGKLGEKRELKHALSGVAETPVVHSAEPTQQQPEWRVRDRHFRAALTMDGPVRTPWLRAELPLDQVGVAAGSFFDAESVSVPGAGEVLVDCDEPVFGAWTKEAAWALGVSGGAMRDDSAEVRVDGRGMRCVSSYGKADGKYGWLRLTKPLDVRYDTIEMRLAISGRAIAMIEYTAEENGKAVKKSVSLGEAVTAGAWPDVTVTQMPDGLPLVRANWHAMLRRSGLPMPKGDTTATLRFQLFASTVQVSDVRQTRSRPVVYMSVVTGQKPPTFMYWDYRATRPERASGAGDVTGPEHVAAMRTGGVEVPGVAAEVRPKGVSVVTAARMRQVAAVWREADGRLAREEQLSSGDAMHWTGQRFGAAFEVWATDGVSQVIRARGDEGHLRTMLRRSPPTPVFTVKGQVESLDCDGPGNWAVVGAAEVTCVNFAGAVIWSAAVGENVRQPEHFGGGRNVQQVQITRDGQRSLARTFRYDDKQKAYVDSVVHVFDRKGQVITQLPCAWEDDARFDEAGAVELTRLVDGKRVRLRIDPVQGQSATSPITPEPKRDLPPYTLHKLPLKDGRLIVATTQGLVQLLDGAGKVVWSTERPSRIDDARLLAGGRGVVIAWKRYTDRVSWVCEPTVEVLDLAGGKSRWSNAAGAVDDHGHYGTPLRLATSADGRRVWLGDQAGRVYCFEPEIGPSVVP